jgi:hypothetical protein
MTRALVLCCGLVAVAVAVPSVVRAQVREGRWEIAGGAGIAAKHDLGTVQATETGNGVPSGSPVTLFDAVSSLDRGPLFEGRVAWHLTRALAVEGTFGVTRTRLRTAITNDFEHAPPQVSTTPLTQYTVEGGVALHLDRLTFGHGRVRPFITGGGGYLRQLNDRATLVQTGESAFAGGGLKYRVHEAKTRAALKALGVRFDVRANFTHGGFDTDTSAWRTYPSLTGGVFVCF